MEKRIRSNNKEGISSNSVLGGEGLKNITKLFEIHMYQLQDKFIRAKENLEEIIKPAYDTKSLAETAIWLWILMEQIERNNERELLQKYEVQVEQAISQIKEGWCRPNQNLWKENEDLVYVSNLGVYYGALSVAKKITGNGDIQHTLTAIRDKVFSSGLSQGMLVRALEVKEVSTDLLLTVMPFGLFSPEDLIIVEAVKEIEEGLVSNHKIYKKREDTVESPSSGAWMAWYFVEKKDIKKAKKYIEMTQKMIEETSGQEVELAKVILKIALIYFNSSNNEEAVIQINHNPFGNDNPYEILKTERFPRVPKEGEDVRVYAQVWPELENIEVFLEVKAGERQFQINCLKTDVDNEIVWEGCLGEFDFKEKVNYYFSVYERNQLLKKGEVHTFYPLKSNRLVDIQGVCSLGDSLWVKGRDLLNLNPMYIGISNRGEGVKLQVNFNCSLGEDVCLLEESTGRKGKLTWEDTETYIVIANDNWICKLEKNPFQIQFFDSKGKTLLRSYDKIFPTLQWWENNKGETLGAEWYFYTSLEERFYGLGERYNRLEYRGEELDCYVYNQYRNQGNRTYIPVPFYISSNGYGLLLENSLYSTFDFASSFQDLLSIKTDINPNSRAFTITVFPGKPKEVCQQYTSITGKPVLPPVWAFGPWMSSNNWDRDDIVREQVEKTKAYQIPSTVIVLEQWSDETTYYIFNDAEYHVKPGNEHFEYEDFHFPKWGRWPDPKGLIEYIHQNGFKILLWQIPIQKYLNRQKHPQKDLDEKYMLEEGYTVQNSDKTPYRIPEGWFMGSLLMDFSNFEGHKWWFNKRKYLLDIGVDGFKTDGGEFVFGKELRFADGRTGAEMRNTYPNDYVEAYYRFVTDYHNGDGMTFSRAGFIGAQNFPAHWAGDERSTFEAFRHSLIAGLSSGISGIPFWGWDLAGFNGDTPTCELFVRSAQMAAFCPIMQYHAESKGEFNQDRTPWNIAERTGDQRAIEGYRFYANVRMNLLPYIYHQARKTSETGIPLMKTLMMEFPEDVGCDGIYDQYMFGDDLLVAPVIEEGQIQRMVYFPEGEWISLWNSEIIQGPLWKKVKAPFMNIPVFVKRGGVILSNCDESLKLGSWVGNTIEHYHNPVLRLYLKDRLQVTIEDHINQRWHIEVMKHNKEWHIDVMSPEEVTIMIPRSLIVKGEGIILNGVTKEVSQIAVKEDYYLI